MIVYSVSVLPESGDEFFEGPFPSEWQAEAWASENSTDCIRTVFEWQMLNVKDRTKYRAGQTGSKAEP